MSQKMIVPQGGNWRNISKDGCAARWERGEMSQKMIVPQGGNWRNVSEDGCAARWELEKCLRN
jgi:hypothetical protein